MGQRAKSRVPQQHTYILDTLGQYKKLFCSKHDDICEKNIEIQPEDITDITALKGFFFHIVQEEEASPLMRQMNIFQLGGGNVTIVLYLLSAKEPSVRDASSGKAVKCGQTRTL